MSETHSAAVHKPNGRLTRIFSDCRRSSRTDQDTQNSANEEDYNNHTKM